MQHVGSAADGYAIYGPECPSAADDLKSTVRRLCSGYRLSDHRVMALWPSRQSGEEIFTVPATALNAKPRK